MYGVDNQDALRAWTTTPFSLKLKPVVAANAFIRTRKEHLHPNRQLVS